MFRFEKKNRLYAALTQLIREKVREAVMYARRTQALIRYITMIELHVCSHFAI